MRLSVNAVLAERESAEQADQRVVGKTPRTDDSIMRVMSELSHDLRQPLTSLNMNLQTAVKMLKLPAPQISVALEALADCLSTERDMIELLAHAKRRATSLAGDGTVPLNEVARE